MKPQQGLLYESLPPMIILPYSKIICPWLNSLETPSWLELRINRQWINLSMGTWSLNKTNGSPLKEAEAFL